MRNWTPGNPPASSAPILALATRGLLAAAGIFCAIWLWCCWCSFPAIPWNDIRIAPAVALHHGISAYSTATAGPVTTWTYGPLPILLMWPAGFASTASGALEVAGALHIGLTVLALALTCLWWPAPTGTAPPATNRAARLAAALLCVLLVRNPTSGYIVFSADAPGMALGLLSFLALSRRHYWAAAAAAAGAAACKQTMVDVGLAQFVWLYFAVSPRAAWQQAGRCVVAGTVIAALAVPIFGGPALWYTIFQLPGRFPGAPLLERIRSHEVYLLVHVALPFAGLLFGRRYFLGRHSPLLLPALAFLCTLPLSLAGLFRIGGNVNSLHSFWLWFPPTLTVLVTGDFFIRLGQIGRLGLAALAMAVASLWLQTSSLPVRPDVQAYREATYLAARLPERIWFPLHPLVTLYSDGRLYHDLDGLTVRAKAAQPVSAEQFFAYMPRHRQATAMLLPVGWSYTDIALARLPKDTPVATFGLWRIDGSLK